MICGTMWTEFFQIFSSLQGVQRRNKIFAQTFQFILLQKYLLLRNSIGQITFLLTDDQFSFLLTDDQFSFLLTDDQFSFLLTDDQLSLMSKWLTAYETVLFKHIPVHQKLSVLDNILLQITKSLQVHQSVWVHQADNQEICCYSWIIFFWYVVIKTKWIYFICKTLESFSSDMSWLKQNIFTRSVRF